MDWSKARAIFLEESRELCDALEGALLDPAAFPADAETFNLLLRTAHTIKGSAGTFGFDALVAFAHAMESVLERLRRGKLALGEDLVSLLLSCNDHLRRMLEAVEASALDAEPVWPDGAPLLQRLQLFLLDGAACAVAGEDALDAAATPLWQLSLRFYPDLFRDGFDPLSCLRFLSQLGALREVELVWPPLPAFAELEPTDCFIGLELSLESKASLEQVCDAFEFVAEGSLLGILPPHAPLAAFRSLAERLGDSIEPQLSRWMARGALTAAEAEWVREAPWLARPESEARGEPGAAAGRAGRGDSHYIRVEAGKLDRLINRVGELVIASAGTKLIAQSRCDAELLESVAIINTLVESIRDDALTLRMVPVDEVFCRFPRMVREVSRQLGKSIQLTIQGADTEIDKSMVERLTDPLMHLVRNAVDHGLETAAERREAGKPETGKVTLNAFHDAGSVVVEIQDDGRGIDRGKVLAKALERGLLSEGRQLSEQETLQLIFLPGFSTAHALSDLSGRGMGLDVVKRNIELLRGEIEIFSLPGQGTTFRLRLPLTLAIIDGFRVEVNDSSLVMPLDMMIECVDMPEEAMRQNARQINVRGDWLPFVSLRELFNLPPAAQPEYVVIVHYGENRAGVVVDRLMGEVQAVIKPLGEIFRSLRGISGSTILGNGKPALVLDIPQLIHHACRRERRRIRQSSEAQANDVI
ncbi:chemotaxis protein CheA [Chromobacterium sp. IRSSSOUMB001]|uniref:chemotaxis protein CheA n=1 Tax=Chromobacterium sp. IRSSSOUMB001 TaxID=2927123 RepID=UPI0020C0115C|nr:chemotaxis protein CheA [Chromobacterium sp. IRSSSOUMB001]